MTPRLAYRVAEASALVGLSEREGWRRVAAGDWPSVKCGRVTLVPASVLEDWLSRKLDEQNAAMTSLSRFADPLRAGRRHG